MARTATTEDVFNAIAEERRREILDALCAGEVTVGGLVSRLGIAQPLVSKHLAVLRSVDLVRARIDGRVRWYRVNGPALQPLQDWLARYESLINARFDRLDEYLHEIQNEVPVTVRAKKLNRLKEEKI